MLKDLIMMKYSGAGDKNLPLNEINIYPIFDSLIRGFSIEFCAYMFSEIAILLLILYLLCIDRKRFYTMVCDIYTFLSVILFTQIIIFLQIISGSNSSTFLNQDIFIFSTDLLQIKLALIFTSFLFIYVNIQLILNLSNSSEYNNNSKENEVIVPFEYFIIFCINIIFCLLLLKINNFFGC